MTTHELKTWPTLFTAMWRGLKTFDIRKDDRGFAAGDVLHLREWDPYAKSTTDSTERGYTGREIVADVPYLLRGGRFGIAKDHVVMSLNIKRRAAASARLSQEPDGETPSPG